MTLFDIFFDKCSLNVPIIHIQFIHGTVITLYSYLFMLHINNLEIYNIFLRINIETWNVKYGEFRTRKYLIPNIKCEHLPRHYINDQANSVINDMTSFILYACFIFIYILFIYMKEVYSYIYIYYLYEFIYSVSHGART